MYVLRSGRLSCEPTDLSEEFSSFSFRVPQRSPQCYSLADVHADVLCAEMFVPPDNGQPEESKVSVLQETVREQLL